MKRGRKYGETDVRKEGWKKTKEKNTREDGKKEEK